LNTHLIKLYLGVFEIELMIFLVGKLHPVESALSFFMADTMGSQVAEVNIMP
jgi:hypothetical protein